MALIDQESKKQLKVAHRVGAVGLELVLSIVVGGLGGWWLDGMLDTGPALTYVGAGFGVLAGFRGLYRVAKQTHLDEM